MSALTLRRDVIEVQKAIITRGDGFTVAVAGGSYLSEASTLSLAHELESHRAFERYHRPLVLGLGVAVVVLLAVCLALWRRARGQ